MHFSGSSNGNLDVRNMFGIFTSNYLRDLFTVRLFNILIAGSGNNTNKYKIRRTDVFVLCLCMCLYVLNWLTTRRYADEWFKSISKELLFLYSVHSTNKQVEVEVIQDSDLFKNSERIYICAMCLCLSHKLSVQYMHAFWLRLLHADNINQIHWSLVIFKPHRTTVDILYVHSMETI